MIRPPRRAVTRFLIPFIDVLILLFCIFLLMPFVSRPESQEPASGTDQATNLHELRSELAKAHHRIDSLSKERRTSIENLRLCILEIDGKTGRLIAEAEESSGLRVIRSAQDARRLIERERSHSRGQAVGVILRYPRQLTGFPLRSQLEEYKNWFRSEPLAIDIPGRLN